MKEYSYTKTELVEMVKDVPYLSDNKYNRATRGNSCQSMDQVKSMKIKHLY